RPLRERGRPLRVATARTPERAVHSLAATVRMSAATVRMSAGAVRLRAVVSRISTATVRFVLPAGGEWEYAAAVSRTEGAMRHEEYERRRRGRRAQTPPGVGAFRPGAPH